MIRVPKYIKSFMGSDFRSIEGVDACFELSDFEDSNFDCGVENRPGCYVISSPDRLIEYANGKKSSILYIGCSDKLFRRLHDEHYMKHYRILAKNKDVFYCKGNQLPKNFESVLLASFYDMYRCTPVGNAARSFRIERK